jgi:hypothetical protein
MVNKLSRIALLLSHVALAAPPAAALLPQPSLAQTRTPDEQRASKLLVEGQELRQKGQHTEALEKFREAYRILQSPILGLALAQGELSVGQLLEAQQSLLAVSRLPESPKEKPKSKRARVDAALLLVDLTGRIPVLQVSVKGLPVGQDVVLRVAGNTLTLPAADHGVSLNPGSYEVVAKASGRPELHRQVQLDEGARIRVEMVFPPDVHVAPMPATLPSVASVTATVPIVVTLPPPVPPAANEGPGALPWIVGGVGAAALAGAVGLELARSSKNDVINQHCNATGCDQDGIDAARSAKSLQTYGAVAWIVGGVGVATGTVLYFTLGGQKNTTVALRPGGFAWTTHW